MKRPQFIEQIFSGFEVHSMVAILGPRQCEKTTLARLYREEVDSNGPDENYFDLENPYDLARLDDPITTLSQLNGLVVIDEIQRRPDLFPALRVLVDAPQASRRYLILGSASRELIQQSSETLTGRIHYMELTPLNLTEVDDMERLWLRGGFPRSYLAPSDQASALWRRNYIRNFLEQDIPNLGIQVAPSSLRRLWMMLVHFHGGIFNASELARSLGINYKTVQHYVDILSDTLMIRRLPAWYENIGKRQVKVPKIYFRDSGLYHSLLGVEDRTALLTHPKLGASWEGLALEEIIRYHNASPDECYFWATHAHAELDLLLIQNGCRRGFEFKYTDAPRKSKSMHVACEDLKLDSLTVVYPGKVRYPLGSKMTAVGLSSYLDRS